ncbi:unnamed protein product [Urochloa decumbens]|uniref:WRKY domain-containing protein n=1 Tax=Urochloa decumbens TaxID=240449 RepID=A0ABC8ZMS7_9POAL
MSSYQALLSLSPADWIGAGEFADDSDEAAAVSSYLSLDGMNGVGEEGYVVYHPPEPQQQAAAFHAEQQKAPETLLFDTLQADYCASVVAGSTSSEGEPGKQSRTRTDASVALSSDPTDNGFVTTSAAATGDVRRVLPARKGGGSGGKIAFKTRSEVEVLDDGYRWRKYGKKLVKNSPNPRNYYRCSAEGCAVKKRVERARDDASFVITTYDGVHNHPAAPAPHHRLRDYRLFDPPPPPAQGSLARRS